MCVTSWNWKLDTRHQPNFCESGCKFLYLFFVSAFYRIRRGIGGSGVGKESLWDSDMDDGFWIQYGCSLDVRSADGSIERSR
jgi:hypothetical protein